MDVPEEAFVVLVNENPQENVGVGGILLADRKQSCEESIEVKPKRSGCRKRKTEV